MVKGGTNNPLIFKGLVGPEGFGRVGVFYGSVNFFRREDHGGRRG